MKRLKKLWISVLNKGFQLTLVYEHTNDAGQIIGEEKEQEAFVDKATMLTRITELT